MWIRGAWGRNKRVVKFNTNRDSRERSSEGDVMKQAEPWRGRNCSARYLKGRKWEATELWPTSGTRTAPEEF